MRAENFKLIRMREIHISYTYERIEAINDLVNKLEKILKSDP